jgi:hypothetical protein
MYSINRQTDWFSHLRNRCFPQTDRHISSAIYDIDVPHKQTDGLVRPFMIYIFPTNRQMDSALYDIDVPHEQTDGLVEPFMI